MAPSPTRLLQITDTHLRAEPGARMKGMDTNASLLAVLEAARREAPDGVLLTGDLVHDGSAQGYRRLAAHVERLGAPAWAIPGNHDDPQALARELGDCGFGGRPLLRLGEWDILLLSSYLPGEIAGALDTDTLERLDADLAASGLPAMIALHHPPVPVGSPWMDAMGLRDPEAFWAVVDRHPRVRAVVWGHAHQAFEHRRGAVRLLGTPSTCVQFTPGSTRYVPDPAPPGYRVIDLHGDGALDTRVVRVPLPGAGP